MNFEIDFLPIGNKTCGDSFLLRFGFLNNGNPLDQTTILIDGGFTDDHEKIKAHLAEHYGNIYIDLAVSTHPDQDHINGLSGVMENVMVAELWMHLPWLHMKAMEEWKAANFSSDQLDQKLAKSLQASVKLAETASNNGATIKEPFANETRLVTPHGTVTVVGPSRDYYESLVPQFFDWHPKSKIATAQLSALEKLLGSIKKAAEETFDIETLSDRGDTSPQNNSSAMILIEHGDKKFLFTGDAGIEAIELAAQELETLGHQPGSYNLVQVPHHGSRHNVGPTILNRVLGSKVSTDGALRGLAYVSAAAECVDHPKKSVMNAFRRRGYPVVSTEGVGKLFHNLDTMRAGYSPSSPHPLYLEVEEDG